MSLLKRFSQNQLIRGSILLFIGNNLTSFGNLLYNFLMGRFLGPEKYGDLGALVSLFVLIGAPLGILNLFVVKTVSSYWGKGSIGSIVNFLSYFTPRIFIIGLIVSVILLIGNPSIVHFLNQESFLPVLILTASYILSGPSTLNRAILQGTLSFPYITINGLIEISIKLFLSLILVVLNFKLVGALLGPFVGGIIGYFLTLHQLRIIFRGVAKTKDRVMSFELIHSIIPVFLASLTLTIFFTVDIILVRHYFSASFAGEYVALSTLGKIIFYIVGPVISVMFPIVSSRASKGASYIIPLLGTLVIALGFSSAVMFVYFLFPKLIISLFFGSRYLMIIPFLGPFSFFITIYTVNYILTQFLLSISVYKPIFLLFLVSLLQSLLIVFIHNSITEIILINIITSTLYFLMICFFVWQNESKSVLILFPFNRFKNIHGR